ncbi:E3 ubiquitin-protein ligase TRIM11 [Alligator mississippiensis]|uniref:E3 ubiquitin-protein ligase TRIM11 n=1 Tax=Alligator mississippiensis TaxID=8496 RepID=UPI0003D09F99|nr:E3 ubiquitin-protein ligase TRIM11 [Alligator mississippiensis]
MAAGDLAGSFQEEVTCSLCLDYFTDPVITDCGHNFCRTCISKCWGELEPNVCCPQCRETAPQRNLRPNRQLGNMVELVKQLKLQAGREPEGQYVCERHQEALKLFCEENEAPICVICKESREHQGHKVLPIEEAAKDYKEQIRSCLEHLREQREELQGLKCAWEKESERLLRQAELERQLVVSECEGLRQLLGEHERFLLARLGELDAEIMRKREENAAYLCKETARLSSLIMELEGKCQQPVPELLQGVRSAYRFSWYNTSTDPTGTSYTGNNTALLVGEEVMPLHPGPKFPDLEKRIQNFPKEKKLQEAVMGFLKGLAAERVDVTLDPGTAYPELILSEDRKCVRHGDTQQDLPNNPERFDTCPEVLGSEKFTGGRYYWEVEVGDKTCWALGVCRESVHRKGLVTLSPEDGYWVMWLRDQKFKALTTPPTRLPMRLRPRKVGVFLDYEVGEVSFYNVTDGSHLFTFTETFSGTLRPYFYTGLSAGGTNATPLILCPVPTKP